MYVFIIGERPENEEKLKEIWGHEEIIFLDTLEDYQRWCELRDGPQLNGKKSTLIIVDDVEIHTPKPTMPRTFYQRPAGKSWMLATILGQLDFADLEARVLASDFALEDVYDSRKNFADMVAKCAAPEPIMPIHTGDRRRSKGEKRGNRRYRWC